MEDLDMTAMYCPRSRNTGKATKVDDREREREKGRGEREKGRGGGEDKGRK